MITIKIPYSLNQYADEASNFNSSADTVSKALNDLVTTHPQIKRFIYKDENTLSDFIRIYINNKEVDPYNGLDSTWNEDVQMTLLTAIAGG